MLLVEQNFEYITINVTLCTISKDVIISTTTFKLLRIHQWQNNTRHCKETIGRQQIWLRIILQKSHWRERESYRARKQNKERLKKILVATARTTVVCQAGSSNILNTTVTHLVPKTVECASSPDNVAWFQSFRLRLMLAKGLFASSSCLSQNCGADPSSWKCTPPR